MYRIHFSLQPVFLICFLALSSFGYGQEPSATIQSEMSSQNIPGVSAGIIKDGKWLWTGNFGYSDIAGSVNVTDSTPFLMASISKVFTATAVMQLADSGLIDIDDPINNYLPFQVIHPGFPSTQITIRQLLTHTSGIQDNDAVTDNYYYYNQDPTMGLDSLCRRYFYINGTDYDAANNFLSNEPGTFYEYSNMAVALLGRVAESVMSQSFIDWSNDYIFNPLCMEKTSWLLADYNQSELAIPYTWSGSQQQAQQQYTFADFPNGGLRSNILDAGRFMQMYLNSGSFNGGNFLNSNTISSMWSIQNSTLDDTQGLGWYTEVLYSGNTEYTCWGHNGGETGVSTDMYLLPSQNIGLVVLTNGEGDNLYMADAMLEYALNNTPTGSDVACSVTTGLKSYGENMVLISAFPNPSVEHIRLKSDESIVSSKIFSIDGKHIDAFTGVQYNCDKLPAGIYLIEVITGSSVQTIRFVKSER